MDKETRQTVIQIAAVSSIGIALAVAVFGCFFLGRWLDGKLGTEPYLTFFFLLIGIAAGFRNMYVLLKRYVNNGQKIGTGVTGEPQGKRSPPTKA
ncbi:MAG: AtpZ/AtpI family protein [Syntrophales bacterium]